MTGRSPPKLRDLILRFYVYTGEMCVTCSFRHPRVICEWKKLIRDCTDNMGLPTDGRQGKALRQTMDG